MRFAAFTVPTVSFQVPEELCEWMEKHDVDWGAVLREHLRRGPNKTTYVN